MASTIKADTLQSTTSNVFVLNSAGTEYARFHTTDGITFSNGGAERVRITNDGNVGIGTTGPSNFGGTNLQVANTNIASVVWTNGTHTGQLLASASAEVTVGSRSNHPLRFSTNDTERMRIDSSGRVTMPYQPSFYGGRTAGNVGTHTVFVMNDAQINIGSCYNTTTGEFTCPVAGIYYASFGVMSVGAFVSDIDFFSIQKNSVSVVNNYLTGRNATHQRVSATVLINCAANDTIRFRTGGVTIYGSSSTHSFGSIYLLG